MRVFWLYHIFQLLKFRTVTRRTAMHVLILLVLVLHVQQTASQMVQCYTNFFTSDGTCGNLLGQVSLDNCCMNPAYGYKKTDNVCMSCRFPSWTSWSHWSACSVTCTEGVRQRQRVCYGLGKCSDPYDLGNKQTKTCEDTSCCPEIGTWSEWSPWELCSVTCERGFRKRNRICTFPSPKCEVFCEGVDEDVGNCDTGIVCPTHGGWSEWSNWGACAGACQVEGLLAPQQQRHRTCTNPSPSLSPRGNSCSGPSEDTQFCTKLPFCPVNGNWGAWSEASPCSVTCGLGLQVQQHNCDNPAPKYGGQYCPGDKIKQILCTIPLHCPVDGQWGEWTEWADCEAPNQRSITCKNKNGLRRRLRECEGRAFDGASCEGESVQFGQCYNINGCKAGPTLQIPKAFWSEWTSWSYCKPDCGENSIQTRKRECEPDLSKYSNPDRHIFFGKPDIRCTPAETIETRQCLNLPPC